MWSLYVYNVHINTLYILSEDKGIYLHTYLIKVTNLEMLEFEILGSWVSKFATIYSFLPVSNAQMTCAAI